jgi:predicted DsbA family dithiol-disulfide isomerase
MVEGTSARTVPVRLDYFSDVLCIWAYGSQVRVDELKRVFAGKVALHYRFIPLFAATAERIGRGWAGRGGFAAFGRHVREVAGQWSHVEVHPKLWEQDVPPSSIPAHLFLKAVQLMQDRGDVSGEPVSEFDSRTAFEEAVWRVRCAFFRDARDVASVSVLEDIAAQLGLDVGAIKAMIDCGEAHAALHLDDEAKQQYQVPGSPTFIMDEGRQRLYGNVGYRIIEANVRELLHDPHYGEASWC